MECIKGHQLGWYLICLAAFWLIFEVFIYIYIYIFGAKKVTVIESLSVIFCKNNKNDG